MRETFKNSVQAVNYFRRIVTGGQGNGVIVNERENTILMSLDNFYEVLGRVALLEEAYCVNRTRLSELSNRAENLMLEMRDDRYLVNVPKLKEHGDD